MTAITTRSLGIATAKEFIDAITVPTMNVNVFVAISHVQNWPNDSAPPAPIDCIDDKVGFWRGMIGGKRITGNDICLVVPRVNWTNNTPYTQYTNDQSLVGNNFYIMTDTFNVYKCLDNANNANSIIKPTYTTIDTTHKESDGYVWKYMLTLSSSDRTRFLSPDWMPIRTLTLDDASLQWDVQEAAHDGGIEIIKVSNGGVGYNNTSNILVSVRGDGTGAVATANMNLVSQTVSFITITNPGTGYHYANAVISGGGGVGAAITPVISPFGGHGSGPVEELLASNLMINVQLKNSENNKITVKNDYRQIGILKNPLGYASSNVYGNSAFAQCFTLTLSSGGSDYTQDEFVIQGGAEAIATFSGRVLDWDSANNVLRLTEIGGSPSSAALTGLVSGTSRFVIGISNYDLSPYSGTIIYMDNIAPIQRDPAQDENIQIVFAY